MCVRIAREDDENARALRLCVPCGSWCNVFLVAPMSMVNNPSIFAHSTGQGLPYRLRNRFDSVGCNQKLSIKIKCIT